MVYFLSTAQTHQLRFYNSGSDIWEDLYILLFCDASHSLNSRSTGGYIVILASPNGSSYPLAWESKLLTIVFASSTESEVAAWRQAARQGVKIGAMLERLRLTAVRIEGRVDNGALRLGVE